MQVEAILVNIDLDGNMRLDYDEFIAATIHMRNLDRADVLLEVRCAARRRRRATTGGRL